MMIIYNILYNYIYFLDIYEYKMVIKCNILYLVLSKLIAYVISWSYEVIFHPTSTSKLKFIIIQFPLMFLDNR